VGQIKKKYELYTSPTTFAEINKGDRLFAQRSAAGILQMDMIIQKHAKRPGVKK